SVSGLSGTGAGVGTVLATYLTGIVADRYSFRPVLIVASLIPLVAAAAILILVKGVRLQSGTTGGRWCQVSDAWQFLRWPALSAAGHPLHHSRRWSTSISISSRNAIRRSPRATASTTTTRRSKTFQPARSPPRSSGSARSGSGSTP